MGRRSTDPSLCDLYRILGLARTSVGRVDSHLYLAGYSLRAGGEIPKIVVFLNVTLVR